MYNVCCSFVLCVLQNGRQLLDNFLEVCGYADEDATPTSSSSEYFRESVVMRPKSTLSIERPRSSIEDGKRNSKTTVVTPADLPIVVERRRTAVASPTVSCRSMVNSGDSYNNNGSDSQTPTPETQSMNGFEADFTTGTIKRQPTPTNNKCAPRLPLTDGTRQLHSAAANRPLVFQYDSISLPGAESKGSGEEEPDSDEELPPPPVQLREPFVRNGGGGGNHEFPPPPSPDQSPLHHHNPNISSSLRDSTTRTTRMTSSFTATSSHNDRCSADGVEKLRKSNDNSQPSLNISSRCSRGSVDSQTESVDSGLDSNNQSKPKFKRAPPIPPKRSENTRLSTASIESPVSPAPCFPSPSSSTDVRNGVPVLPSPKQKPAVPAKPKLPLAYSSQPTLVEFNTSPTPMIPAATDAFNSELQRAMQRRLRKMNETNELELNSTR